VLSAGAAVFLIATENAPPGRRDSFRSALVHVTAEIAYRTWITAPQN